MMMTYRHHGIIFSYDDFLHRQQIISLEDSTTKSCKVDDLLWCALPSAESWRGLRGAASPTCGNRSDDSPPEKNLRNPRFSLFPPVGPRGVLAARAANR